MLMDKIVHLQHDPDAVVQLCAPSANLDSMALTRIALIVLYVFLLVSGAFATAQAPDVLVYQGEKKDLFSNPLEVFYESANRKRPKFMIQPMTISSGNWRGYIATWEVENQRLYLRDIQSWLCPRQNEARCRKVTLASLFPGKVRDGRVSADWFTGELRIPDGEQLRYVHSGYASIYERDRLKDRTERSIVLHRLTSQVVDSTCWLRNKRTRHRSIAICTELLDQRSCC